MTMDNNPILKMESIVMEYSGPLGKFVVRKQIKDMAIDLEDSSENNKKELIDRVVVGAVYNDKFKEECASRLKSLLINKTQTA